METKNLIEKDIFYSFLNAAVGKGKRVKFNKLFNIPIYDKKNHVFGHITFVTKKNKIALLSIYSGYFIFWFAVLKAAHDFFETFIKEYKKDLNKNFIYDSFMTIDTFYYFFRNYFNEFFELNDYLYNLGESFVSDIYFSDQLIDTYNLNFYHSLDFFFLLLNMEALKYEHDKCLTPEKNWKDIPIKVLSHFDYDILDYCNSFFNSFYIIESYRVFKNIKSNWINSNFFDIYFLFNTGISEIDFVIEKEENNHKCNDYFPFILAHTRLNERLDINIIHLKDFKLTISLDFFLIFNFYTLYLRRLRFNYYMRNLPIFYEYTRWKFLFILVNNPFGRNKTQVDILRYQQLYTIAHYNSYTSNLEFNLKFKFFHSKFTRRKWFYQLDDYLDNFIFKILLNDPSVNFTLKLNDTKSNNLIDSPSKSCMYIFLYDSSIDILDFYFHFSAFKLVMRFKSVFKFALTNSTYLELPEFVDVIYTNPKSLYRYHSSLQIDFFNQFYYNIYCDNLIIPNFFKDFLHLYKDDEYYFYYLKLSSFFIKLYSFVIRSIDTFLFEHYHRNFFYKWTWPYIFLLYYATVFLVYRSIRKINKLSHILIQDLEMVMFHFNWRFNISPYPNIDNTIYFYTHGLVNGLSFSRLSNLYNKILFFFKYKNISVMHKNFRYSIFLKNLYFSLLYENIELSLIFFFFSIEKYKNIFINFFYESLSDRLNATFIYRYYYFTILLDFDRYRDWFDDWTKREFWIYYYWKQYEGYEFYKKRDYL